MYYGRIAPRFFDLLKSDAKPDEARPAAWFARQGGPPRPADRMRLANSVTGESITLDIGAIDVCDVDALCGRHLTAVFCGWSAQTARQRVEQWYGVSGLNDKWHVYSVTLDQTPQSDSSSDSH